MTKSSADRRTARRRDEASFWAMSTALYMKHCKFARFIGVRNAKTPTKEVEGHLRFFVRKNDWKFRREIQHPSAQKALNIDPGDPASHHYDCCR
jgi:hypothetical protein